jgi:hypothetical protein
MLDWFEFERSDPSPVATLVAGLPVDDGELAVAVEPLRRGGAPKPGLLDRLRGRADEVGAVGLAIVRKYASTRTAPHYLVELRFSPRGDTRFADRVSLPQWAELDESEPDKGVFAAPLSVTAPDLVGAVARLLDQLVGDEAGSTWRTVEADARHVPGLHT